MNLTNFSVLRYNKLHTIGHNLNGVRLLHNVRITLTTNMQLIIIEYHCKLHSTVFAALHDAIIYGKQARREVWKLCIAEPHR
jgi:hypothetical protein